MSKKHKQGGRYHPSEPLILLDVYGKAGLVAYAVPSEVIRGLLSPNARIEEIRWWTRPHLFWFKGTWVVMATLKDRDFCQAYSPDMAKYAESPTKFQAFRRFVLSLPEPLEQPFTPETALDIAAILMQQTEDAEADKPDSWWAKHPEAVMVPQGNTYVRMLLTSRLGVVIGVDGYVIKPSEDPLHPVTAGAPRA